MEWIFFYEFVLQMKNGGHHGGRTDSFCYCTSLTKIIIPPNINKLGPGCFCYSGDLETADIQSNKIEAIPVDCFLNCQSLTKIDFKDGVTRIEWNAFSGCCSLKIALFPGSVSVLNPNIFNKDDELTVFTSSPKLVQYCKDNYGAAMQKKPEPIYMVRGFKTVEYKPPSMPLFFSRLSGVTR